MKLYEVKVMMYGADSPRNFYFRKRGNALNCYDSFEHADYPEEFEATDFPEDMLSD